MIYRDTRSGYEYFADRNYKDYPRLSATAWTHSTSPTYRRNLMYFNLDTIPKGSQIHSATLYFYSDPAVTGSSAWNGNSQHSGSNAFYLEKITGEWHESTVTWNNQPPTTTSGRIWVGPSNSTTENRQVNLTAMVQSWIDNPISNSGLKMRLENELYYRSRNYASTHHPDANLHPKLVISYTPAATADSYSCGTPDPSEEEYMDIPWYGDENYLNNFYDSLEYAQNNSQPTYARLQTGDIENPWLRVPVKLWIYQIAPGNPGGNANEFPDERRIQRMMDNLNNAFRNNGINMRFYLEDIDFVNDERGIEVGGFLEQSVLANQYRDNNAVNIHVVDEIENNLFNPI
jgi:hypothetical protein